MKFFRDMIEQFTAIWRKLEMRVRILLGLAVALSVLAVVGVTYWSSRPQFITLVQDLPPNDIAAVKTKLDAAGIASQLGFSGSSISVPKSKYSAARLAAKELVGEQNLALEDFESSPMSDPIERQHRLMRSRERVLADTIKRYRAVKNAQVHIARPQPSVFVRDSGATKASVQVELWPGQQLTGSEANAIAMSLANSVEGLTVENITVTDTEGRNYSKSDEGLSDISQQLALKKAFEQDLVQKVQFLLAGQLGPHRALVTVNADLDFKRSTTTETVYDPDLAVATEKTIVKKETTRDVPQSAGAVGASSNTTPATSLSTRRTSETMETSSDQKTSYAVPETQRQLVEPPGRLVRLTVAAVVDLTPESNADAIGGSAPAGGQPSAAGQAGLALAGTAPRGPGTAVTAGSLTLQDVEALISKAVGLDSTRGDEITVVQSRLHQDQQVEADLMTLQWWDFLRDLARNISLGIAAIVALIVALIVLRKMKPISVATEGEVTIEERARVITELSRRMRDNPDTLKDLMAAWMSEPGSERHSAQVRRAA